MISVGVLTVSDGGARGTRVDTSGELVCSLIMRISEAVVSEREVVPDELVAIEGVLREWSDGKHLNLVLTTGGTGLSPRDVTPEATRAVIDREAPGFAEAMRAESLRHTPFGMLSRGVAGTRGRTLIINLPGSPKAVKECLECIQPALPHAVNLLIEGPPEH